jgi:hypothetical protein
MESSKDADLGLSKEQATRLLAMIDEQVEGQWDRAQGQQIRNCK